MTFATIMVLLQSAVLLLGSVHANPHVPESTKATAVEIAQRAITIAKLKLAETPTPPRPLPPPTPLPPTPPLPNSQAPSCVLQVYPVPPAVAAPGDSISIYWTTYEALSALIDQGVGSVGTLSQGSKTIFAPNTSTNYTMTVQGPGGTGICSANIIVSGSGSKPKTLVRGPESLIIDAENVYSPNVISTPSGYRMYFGGWYQRGQIHDDIYVADCTIENTGPKCTNVRESLDAVAYGFDHINDPNVIKVTPGNYVMYFTGLPQGGYWQTDNNIYFSTSPAGDGINWSPPKRLLTGYWNASAVVNPDNTVYLYASVNSASTDNLDLMRYVLDTGGGFTTQGPQKVTIDGVFTHHKNVDVRYNSTTHLYEMLAEFPGGSDGTREVIHFLTSSDGLNFHTVTENVVIPGTNEHAVWTPSATPGNPNLVFYGATSQSNSTEFKIYAQSWTLQ